jgi:hypothetical protein
LKESRTVDTHAHILATRLARGTKSAKKKSTNAACPYDIPPPINITNDMSIVIVFTAPGDKQKFFEVLFSLSPDIIDTSSWATAKRPGREKKVFISALVLCLYMGKTTVSEPPQ